MNANFTRLKQILFCKRYKKQMHTIAFLVVLARDLHINLQNFNVIKFSTFFNITLPIINVLFLGTQLLYYV